MPRSPIGGDCARLDGMPELPEVAALAAFVADHAAGLKVASVHVAAMNVMTTFDPPPAALVGRTVAGAERHGKFLDITVRAAPDPDLHLVVHFARAGWLRWSDALPTAPPKMRGPVALRVALAGGGGFDITEAGTKKSVTAAIVTDVRSVPGIARLGPDALGPDGTGLPVADVERILAGSRAHLKTALTDQSLMAGIGNAYSDEILHTARLSPFATAGTLDADALRRLAGATRDVLTDATRRSIGEEAARLKGEKRSGMRVHGRAGLPCPVCGDTVAEVSYADRSFQYCPTCQTGGRTLADRRMSRLLR